MTLNISLPIELENRVRDHVASGMYSSASEVIREALRLFEFLQSSQQLTLEALKLDLAKGLADVEANRVVSLDIQSVKARGRAALKAKGSV